MRKLTIEQVAWVFKQIMENAGKGTYRYLIYDRMGFKENAYEPLYRAGGLAINNAMFEAYDKKQLKYLNENFDFTKAYVENDTLIVPMAKKEIE